MSILNVPESVLIKLMGYLQQREELLEERRTKTQTIVEFGWNSSRNFCSYEGSDEATSHLAGLLTAVESRAMLISEPYSDTDKQMGGGFLHLKNKISELVTDDWDQLKSAWLEHLEPTYISGVFAHILRTWYSDRRNYLWLDELQMKETETGDLAGITVTLLPLELLTKPEREKGDHIIQSLEGLREYAVRITEYHHPYFVGDDELRVIGNTHYSDYKLPSVWIGKEVRRMKKLARFKVR